MLDLIRRKQKSTFIQIIFWALIAAFVGAIFLWWGVGGKAGAKHEATAMSVNGQEIPLKEFQNTYQMLTNLYRNIYKDRFSPQLEKELNLRGQALERVINQHLLLQQAVKLDIDVDRDELVQRIAQTPAFQVNGKFNRDRYVQVLSFQRMHVKDYEQRLRQDLLVEKVQQRLTADVKVDDSEVVKAYHHDNDKVSLDFVQLAPALFVNKVTIDKAGLADYFKKHQEDFRLPEKVAIRYLKFEPSAFTPDANSISDEEIDRYYRRNQDRFEIEEQVRASHILVRVPQGADDKVKAEKHQRAEHLLDEIRKGKDFAELARTASDDTASAAKGGDLGYFTRGTMVDTFESAAFNLQPGQVSDIVETPFGFHIIKVTAHIEPGVKPLVDVIDQVRAGVAAEKARQLAFEAAMDCYNVSRKAGDIDAAAKAANLPIQETGLFTRDDSIKGLGKIPEVVAEAFALQPNQLGKPIQLEDGTVLIIARKQDQPSRLPELAEVQPQVEKAYRQQKAADMAKARANEMLAQLRKGAQLSRLATDEKLSLETTGLFARSYGDFVPHLGNAPKVAAAAFTLTADKPYADQVFDLNGKQVVVALKTLQPADDAQLDAAKKETLKQRLLNQKRQDVIKARLKELRTQAEIHVGAKLQDFIAAKR